MEIRPKIKLTLSAPDKKAELAGKILLIIMWGLAVYVFLKSPTIIPIHFNASGKADSYGNKMTVLILPVLATIIYFGLTELNKYPHIFNYLTKINEDNAAKQYTTATRMLRFLKLSILLIFSLIIIFTYFATIDGTTGLGIWFLPLTLGLVLMPTIIGLSQLFRKQHKVQ